MVGLQIGVNLFRTFISTLFATFLIYNYCTCEFMVVYANLFAIIIIKYILLYMFEEYQL